MDKIDRLYNMINESYSVEVEVDGGEHVFLTTNQKLLIMEALKTLKAAQTAVRATQKVKEARNG